MKMFAAGAKDIRDLFSSSALIDQVLERYEQDFKRFYGMYSIDSLLNGDALQKLLPQVAW